MQRVSRNQEISPTLQCWPLHCRVCNALFVPKLLCKVRSVSGCKLLTWHHCLAIQWHHLQHAPQSTCLYGSKKHYVATCPSWTVQHLSNWCWATGDVRAKKETAKLTVILHVFNFHPPNIATCSEPCQMLSSKTGAVLKHHVVHQTNNSIKVGAYIHA
jgi:hypothetical protein